LNCKLCGAKTTKPLYVPNKLLEKVPLCRGCFLLLEIKTILAFFNASIDELLQELKKAKLNLTLDSDMEKLLLPSGKGD